MKINGLNTASNLSKAEEIKILETLHKAFLGSGNYLEKLFSSNFTDWASYQIRDDIFPDVIDRFSSDGRENQKLFNEVSQLRNELCTTKAELLDASNRLCEKDIHIKILNQHISAMKAQKDEALDSYSKAHKRAEKLEKLRSALAEILDDTL